MSVASEGLPKVVEPAVPNEDNPVVPAEPAVPVKPVDGRSEGLAISLSLRVGIAVFMNCVPYVGLELKYCSTVGLVMLVGYVKPICGYLALK